MNTGPLLMCSNLLTVVDHRSRLTPENGNDTQGVVWQLSLAVPGAQWALGNSPG